MNINNEPVWLDLNCVGDFTEGKYFGRFCVKPFLTMREQADADRLANDYTRGMPDTPNKDVLWAIAKLKFHILKYEADWWKGDANGIGEGLDLLDSTPILELVKLVGSVQRPKAKTEPEVKA